MGGFCAERGGESAARDEHQQRGEIDEAKCSGGQRVQRQAGSDVAYRATERNRKTECGRGADGLFERDVVP